VDPGLAKPYRAGRNPMVRKLADALPRYRETWGALPRVSVPGGPEFGPGARGPRVKALRARFALPPGEAAYDPALEGAVRAFQQVHGLTVTGRADAATVAALNAGPERYEAAILASLERARALPPKFPSRYVLVDAAAGRLWYYDRGKPRLSMKVVVGKPDQPTPIMAGRLSHAIFNPYWNVPEDLVVTSIAPKVLAGGMKYVREEGLQVLSDYTPNAVELDPAKVDWRGVARGRVSVRVRQRPGPKNMMGEVKLMLPNPLGIYLHDTPHKELFEQDRRLESSGCIRLEDAMALARLLVGERTAAQALDGSGQEREARLKKPVPVYVTYFTATPEGDGVSFRPDAYGRDLPTLRQAGLSLSLARNEAAR
jgi:murein L,D-transpeptidase YcbB/YkuD